MLYYGQQWISQGLFYLPRGGDEIQYRLASWSRGSSPVQDAEQDTLLSSDLSPLWSKVLTSC